MYIVLRLVRIIFVVVLIFFIYRLLVKPRDLRGKKERRFSKKKPANNLIEEMKRDPVCGTYLPESQAIIYKTDDEIFYFCSPECKEKFQKEQAGN